MLIPVANATNGSILARNSHEKQTQTRDWRGGLRRAEEDLERLGDERHLTRGTLFADLRALARVYRGGGSRVEARQRATAAVVLGAQVRAGGRPSRTLRARALFAARLHARGLVRVVIPTGGVGEHPPSEAAAMREVLRGAGVPDGDVLPEERAHNTRESARLVAELAHAEGVESVLVVTDPLHCVRAVSAFREAGLRAAPAPVYDSPMWTSPGLRRGQLARESGAIVWYAVSSWWSAGRAG